MKGVLTVMCNTTFIYLR